MPKFSKQIVSFAIIAGFFIAAVIQALIFYLKGRASLVHGSESLASNLGFFTLINLNIIVIAVLGFLVIKNIVKLFLDRRQRILGARLRTRLVAAFVGLSLIPTVLLFFVAQGIVGSILEGWFSPQIVRAVDGSLAVAKQYYAEKEQELRRYAENTLDELRDLRYLTGLRDFSTAVPEEEQLSRFRTRRLLNSYLEAKAEEYGLSGYLVVSPSGREIASARNQTLLTAGTLAAHQPSIQRALADRIVIRAEQDFEAEYLRAYVPIRGLDTATVLSEVSIDTITGGSVPFTEGVIGVLVVTLEIPPDLSATLSDVVDAYDDYRELTSFKRPIASSYFLTLIIVTMLIVFAAIWVGFYLARGLAEPIQELAAATQEVSSGNLNYRIPAVGDDELGVLVESFNKMTGDLAETTGELVSRRRYMETVLAHLGVGVISIDSNQVITTFNLSASEMCGVEEQAAMGRRVSDILPAEVVESIQQAIVELSLAERKVVTGNTSAEISGTTRHMHLTVSRLGSSRTDELGVVVLIDDISELVSAQRMAAWREVARRIAHEIKNPLTPIQLSAQRMQRRFSGKDQKGLISQMLFGESDREIIVDGTATIIKQVENLRSLVNEFSQFARMPKLNPCLGQINELLEETLRIYREAHPEISFRIERDDSLPELIFDREQMSRVFINLIDNAVASVQSRQEREGSGYKPQIILSSQYQQDLELVLLSIADNGIGVSESEHARLFEPYFSTKKGGTGLGLAIVSSIVADHGGVVRVKNRANGGAVFSIELPFHRADNPSSTLDSDAASRTTKKSRMA